MLIIFFKKLYAFIYIIFVLLSCFLKGFEWATSVNYAILQDIAVSGDLGMFITKNGNVNARFGLKGIISF